MASLVYQGTWEQIASHAEKLRGFSNLRLEVTEPQGVVETLYRTPEERKIAINAFLLKFNKHPYVPDSAFDRENLYD